MNLEELVGQAEIKTRGNGEFPWRGLHLTDVASQPEPVKEALRTILKRFPYLGGNGSKLLAMALQVFAAVITEQDAKAKAEAKQPVHQGR
jgi:hypothetical protein